MNKLSLLKPNYKRTDRDYCTKGPKVMIEPLSFKTLLNVRLTIVGPSRQTAQQVQHTGLSQVQYNTVQVSCTTDSKYRLETSPVCHVKPVWFTA